MYGSHGWVWLPFSQSKVNKGCFFVCMWLMLSFKYLLSCVILLNSIMTPLYIASQLSTCLAIEFKIFRIHFLDWIFCWMIFFIAFCYIPIWNLVIFIYNCHFFYDWYMIRCKPDISRLVGSKHWYRDISESAIYRVSCHEPKSGSIHQRVVSDNGAFPCSAVNSARRQRISYHLSIVDVAVQTAL